MYDTGLFTTMINKMDEVIPSLSIIDILDFCKYDTSHQKCFDETLRKNTVVDNSVDKSNFVQYNTKKEVTQAIKDTTKEIEEWMEQRRQGNPFAEFRIEDCLVKKEKLKSRLSWLGVKRAGEGVDRIALAKQVPIDQFVEFRGGFARCVWHQESTGSMHYYSADNHVYCFSCQKSGDVIDLVMAVNNASLPEALKIILG